jgi:3'-phosphoadenosine 5'-phosphosulfate sulfotransferase (PAPS reductase)/FAD synthetase
MPASNDSAAPEFLDLPSAKEHGQTHIALVSGGMDSAVAAHVAVTHYDVPILTYLDTKTGVTANREYIETLADDLGVQLWTLRTHESYEDMVKEHGFPGPAKHPEMYRNLKERQIRRLATAVGGRGNGADLHLWTGVRKHESRTRMGRVEPLQDGARWTWVAPIAYWTKNQTQNYLDKHDIPENPLWSDLGRSGDCFCGSFGSPAEIMDLKAAGYDDHANWLETLEDEVRENVDEPTERCVWGWGAISSNQKRAIKTEQDNSQMTLCSDCNPIED